LFGGQVKKTAILKCYKPIFLLESQNLNATKIVILPEPQNAILAKKNAKVRVRLASQN